jgi:hypothetical protein
MTAVIGDFSAAKVRGESCWRKDWRREWDSNPEYSSALKNLTFANCLPVCAFVLSACGGAWAQRRKKLG